MPSTNWSSGLTLAKHPRRVSCVNRNVKQAPRSNLQKSLWQPGYRSEQLSCYFILLCDKTLKKLDLLE